MLKHVDTIMGKTQNNYTIDKHLQDQVVSRKLNKKGTTFIFCNRH